MFHIGVWTDIPAGQPEPFSHPGSMIWETVVPRVDTNEISAGCDYYPGHAVDTCFSYEYPMPESEWFYQQPGSTVFWISISAMYLEAPQQFPWGWKTRSHYFNDAAIRILNPLFPIPGGTFILGVPITEPAEIPWDLAFELLTHDEVIPTATVEPTAIPPNIKWSQPPQLNPESPYPTCFWGWDEVSIRGGPQLAADDWLCQDDRPVTGFRWWGSYLNWDLPMPPPITPHSFHITIWTDRPAGQPDPFSHPDRVVWETTFPISAAIETQSGCDFYPGHSLDTCFVYEYHLPNQEWFYQAPGPTIYWVCIEAVYQTLPEDNRWGWKTRPYFYNDAAIRIFDPLLPSLNSLYYSGEPIYDPDVVPWDLSFELFTADVHLNILRNANQYSHRYSHQYANPNSNTYPVTSSTTYQHTNQYTNPTPPPPNRYANQSPTRTPTPTPTSTGTNTPTNTPTPTPTHTQSPPPPPTCTPTNTPTRTPTPTPTSTGTNTPTNTPTPTPTHTQSPPPPPTSTPTNTPTWTPTPHHHHSDSIPNRNMPESWRCQL